MSSRNLRLEAAEYVKKMDSDRHGMDSAKGGLKSRGFDFKQVVEELSDQSSVSFQMAKKTFEAHNAKMIDQECFVRVTEVRSCMDGESKTGTHPQVLTVLRKQTGHLNVPLMYKDECIRRYDPDDHDISVEVDAIGGMMGSLSMKSENGPRMVLATKPQGTEVKRITNSLDCDAMAGKLVLQPEVSHGQNEEESGLAKTMMELATVRTCERMLYAFQTTESHDPFVVKFIESRGSLFHAILRLVPDQFYADASEDAFLCIAHYFLHGFGYSWGMTNYMQKYEFGNNLKLEEINNLWDLSDVHNYIAARVKDAECDEKELFDEMKRKVWANLTRFLCCLLRQSQQPKFQPIQKALDEVKVWADCLPMEMLDWPQSIGLVDRNTVKFQLNVLKARDMRCPPNVHEYQSELRRGPQDTRAQNSSQALKGAK